MLLAGLVCSFLAKRIEVAKLYHFDSAHDRLFSRMGRSSSPRDGISTRGRYFVPGRGAWLSSRRYGGVLLQQDSKS
jgi:hypothetical protein